MRRPVLASIALIASAGAALAVNPRAMPSGDLVLHSTLSEVTGRNSINAEQITDVVPGQTLTITGDCVMRANEPNSLQVVLTLSDASADAPGYRAVVATDQEFSSTGLQVRVPNMPDTANHVFQVKVFQTSAQVPPRVCDAGSIRIGADTTGKVG